MTGNEDVGTRFVAALAVKDTARLLELFADGVAFRGMTPGRFWEASSPEQVVHDVLYRWFGAGDVIDDVERLESGSAVDRQRLDYVLRVHNDRGAFAVEQHVFFDVDGDGRISRMQAMCAGFQPVPPVRSPADDAG